MPDSAFYTHAEWHVRAGHEDEFVSAWRDIARAFERLADPPLWGTLLRSERDPSLFVSFGPWPSREAIAAMRADAGAQAAMQRTLALCERATPGPWRLVEHVQVRAR